MKDSSPAYLLRALGSLPEDKKAAFIKDALRTLHQLQAAHAVWRPAPQKADHAALARLGVQTARLIEAIKGAEESESATMLLRDAWLSLENSSGEIIASPMPGLQRLLQSVERCLPEKRRGPRPVGKAAAPSLAIATLADLYHQHFGRRPTFGSGSPFVRFVRAGFPAYDLNLPSLADIKKIADGEKIASRIRRSP